MQGDDPNPRKLLVQEGNQVFLTRFDEDKEPNTPGYIQGMEVFFRFPLRIIPGMEGMFRAEVSPEVPARRFRKHRGYRV
jgi:hypothetical protein